VAFVIRVAGFASGASCPVAGMYLRAFDFEHNLGRGLGTFTPDITRAKRFSDLSTACEFWRTQSKQFPLRRDGEPNRPFMSSNITFEETQETRH
jgi:hypothetical protein